MKKAFKDLCKLATIVATVATVAYIARDQIKAILNKLKEVISGSSLDDDFDDESFDDEPFDDEDIFPEPSEEDRDYVSINITADDNDETPAKTVTKESAANAAE